MVFGPGEWLTHTACRLEQPFSGRDQQAEDKPLTRTQIGWLQTCYPPGIMDEYAAGYDAFQP